MCQRWKWFTIVPTLALWLSGDTTVPLLVRRDSFNFLLVKSSLKRRTPGNRKLV